MNAPKPASERRAAIRDISVLSYAQGFTLWHHRARDMTLAEVTAIPGFFDPMGGMLAAGDMLMLTASDGGRVLFVASSKEGEGASLVPLS